MSNGGKYPVKFGIDAKYLCGWLQENSEVLAQSEWYDECFNGDELDDIEAWFFIKNYIMPIIQSNIQYDFGVEFDVYELINVEVVENE